MGHYTCYGDDWPPGVTPRCKYCESVATWEAPSGDTLLCDDVRCHTAYVTDQGYAIEYWDEPAEWRRCRACGRAWVFVDGCSLSCPHCRSEDTEAVDENTLAAESNTIRLGGE